MSRHQASPSPAGSPLAARDHIEVELKLDVDPLHSDSLATSALLNLAGQDAHRLDATYFDTPESSLHAAGFSLRIRRDGQRRTQTLKAIGDAATGLFVRPEWEQDLAGDEPVVDPLVFPLTGLVPDDALQRLRPVFRIAVSRTIGHVERDGAVIEVVLDRGDVIDGERTMPISEIELELRKGPPSASFELAREMDAIAPVRLGVLSKSERGYRLVEGKADGPARAEPSALSGDTTVGTAFQRIARACVRQFRLNEALLERQDSPDALHQARVGLRRLRSALAIFRPVLKGDPRYDPLRAELRWLAATLGPARNLDVLLPHIEDAGVAELVRQARDEAYGVAKASLASARGRRLMLDLAEWLALGNWLTAPVDSFGPEEPIRPFAAMSLDRYRRKLKKQGAALSDLGAGQLHALRIESKKLRYAVEFFEPLYRDGQAERDCAAFASTVAKLQTRLGEINDRLVAPTTLASLGVAGELLPAHLRGGLDGLAKALRHAQSQVDAVLRQNRFWR